MNTQEAAAKKKEEENKDFVLVQMDAVDFDNLIKNTSISTFQPIPRRDVSKDSPFNKRTGLTASAVTVEDLIKFEFIKALKNCYEHETKTSLDIKIVFTPAKNQSIKDNTMDTDITFKVLSTVPAQSIENKAFITPKGTLMLDDPRIAQVGMF